MAAIEGFDEAIGSELINRAKGYLDSLQDKLEQNVKTLGVDKELLDITGVTFQILEKLGENEVKTRDDLGGLSRDEFIDIIPNSGLTDAEIDNIIMTARAHWFADDEDAQDEKQVG